MATKVIQVSKNTFCDIILLILVSISLIEKNSLGYKLSIICPCIKWCLKQNPYFQIVNLVTFSWANQSQNDYNDDIISLGMMATTTEERKFIYIWMGSFFFFKYKISTLSLLSRKCTCWDKNIPFRLPGLSLPSDLISTEGENHRVDVSKRGISGFL